MNTRTAARKYYGFQYQSGRNTTSGTPNKTTGRYNTAGLLAVFTSKTARDNWTAGGKVTADMRGNCRESVTAEQARQLHRGMTMADYVEMVEMVAAP